MRESGILMPVSSLPGPFGIGTLGKGAYDFVDFLARAGQRVWQILPLSPTGFGDSPYQSCSAFAGSPWFIDFEPLRRRGLLKKQEYAGISFGRAPCAVDYDAVRETHFAVLRRAFARFSKWYPDDYYHFCYEQGWWLEDYALFMTAKGLEGGRDYRQWPEALRMHEAGAIRELYAGHEAEVHFWKFCQYEFFAQWRALKAYANERACAFWGIFPSMSRPIPPTYGPGASCSGWTRRACPGMWRAARRIIFQPTASFGVTRCTTGPGTRARIMTGG